MKTTIKTYEGRWGLHPCDYQTFWKLKNAHKLLLRAYCDVKRHIKWSRKDEHNRKGPEPIAPVNFEENGFHKLGVDKDGNRRTFYGDGFKRDENGLNYYLRVLEEYQNARHPKTKPDDVIPLNFPNNFDKVVRELEAFYK
jgi:hypothetical protein